MPLVHQLRARAERGEPVPAQTSSHVERGPASAVKSGSTQGKGAGAETDGASNLIDLLVQSCAVPGAAGVDQVRSRPQAFRRPASGQAEADLRVSPGGL